MPTEFGDPTIEELSQQTTEFGDVIAPIPSTAPATVQRGIQDISQFPKMGQLPAPTLGERLQALNIGGLEAIGRLPGELMSATSEMAPRIILGPLAGRAVQAVPGLQQSIEQALAPFQNLTPRAFRAVGVETQLPEAPQFRSPGLASLGEIITNALTLQAGGGTRAVRPAIESVAEGVARIPPILAESRIPGVTRVGNILEKVSERGIISKPLEDVVTRTIGIEPIEGGSEIAQVAKTRILEKTGKIPTRETGIAEDIIRRSDQTQTALIEEAKGFLKSGEEKGLTVRGNPAIQEARVLIEERFPSFSQESGSIESVLSKPEFKNLGEILTPTETQKKLAELNTRYNSLVDKNTPEGLAYRTVRDYLSDQVDSIVKIESGKDISPYRDWGKVQEFKDGLRNQVRQAQSTQAGKRDAPRAGIPVSRAGVVSRAIQSAGGRALIPREIESINKGTLRIFKDVPNTPSARNLSAEEIAGLRANLNPPPIIEGALPSMAVPPPNLEQLIQRTISEYPRDIRSNPALARKVAEQDLMDQGLIPPQ